VRRFAIDSGTDVDGFPDGASVLVRVAATGGPVWRAVLAGLDVEGLIVERADLHRAADVAVRLALEGLQLRVLQVDSPGADEHTALRATFPFDPSEVWIGVGRLDDAGAAPVEEPARDAVRVLHSDR
jgi:hypothetical protein